MVILLSLRASLTLWRPCRGPEEVPSVPNEGHGGAGETLALSRLFLPISEAKRLREKDALCLINSSPGAAAIPVDAALSSRRRRAIAKEILAPSAEVFLTSLDPYDSALEALLDNADETWALESLRGLVGRRRQLEAAISDAGQLSECPALAWAGATGRGGGVGNGGSIAMIDH